MERTLEIMDGLFLTLPLADVEGPDHLERVDWMVRQAEERVELANRIRKLEARVEETAAARR